MDNILKVLLGVLGVAALLALLVPSGDPVAPIEKMAAGSEEKESSPRLPASKKPANEVPGSRDKDISEDFKIGEPLIDGNPIQSDFGMPFGESPPDPHSYSNNVSAQQAAGNVIPDYGNMPALAPVPSGDGDENR